MIPIKLGRALWVSLGVVAALEAAAAPPSTCSPARTFKVEGRALALCFERPVHAWVSTACALAPKPAKRGGGGQTKERAGRRCKALELLDTAAACGPLSEADRRGGKNPGAVLCEKSGGSVRFATLENGSQISFCEASDHSIIDCNALDTAWAEARNGK